VPKPLTEPPFTGACSAFSSLTLAMFPKFLAISLDRLDKSGNMVNDTPVAMPEKLDVGLLRSGGGIQSFEEFWDECPDYPFGPDGIFKVGSLEYMQHFNVGKRNLLSTVDPLILKMICNAGFSDFDARKAVFMTQQEYDKAHPGTRGSVTADDVFKWLLTHRDLLGLYFADSCDIDPEEESNEQAVAAVDPMEELTDVGRQMVGTGFNIRHVKKAMLFFPNNFDRAVEYILSNMEQILTEEKKDQEEEKKRKEREAEERRKKLEDAKARKRQPKYTPNRSQSEYEVFAVISHVSTENSLNHFVLHVRIPARNGHFMNSKWILCDGARFALAAEPPLDSGCFYLYRQV